MSSSPASQANARRNCNPRSRRQKLSAISSCATTTSPVDASISWFIFATRSRKHPCLGTRRDNVRMPDAAQSSVVGGLAVTGRFEHDEQCDGWRGAPDSRVSTRCDRSRRWPVAPPVPIFAEFHAYAYGRPSASADGALPRRLPHSLAASSDVVDWVSSGGVSESLSECLWAGELGGGGGGEQASERREG